MQLRLLYRYSKWANGTKAVKIRFLQLSGFSSFRRQLLEQSSITRYMCTVAGDIPAASQDISLPPVISGLDSLTFLLPHCGPCDNFVI